MGFARGLLWSGKGLDAGKSRVLASFGILDLFGRAWWVARDQMRPEVLGESVGIKGVDRYVRGENLRGQSL